MEYNYEPIVDTSKEKDLLPLPWPPSAEEKELLPPRPPVVTIMGHVDHGKTTLLDYLRKSSVASSEHGGITQHIGAFSVHLSSGRLATFLDTPGHAAFLSMRERGANVTDIVILVVAADDSVMPQTVEAIKHAKAAGVPMIVAVNKCDMESANIENVKSDLARHDVEIEDMGGDTQVIPVSGKTGLGMDDLEEATMALAEVLDMRAEVDGPAEGWILEATTKKRGRVATVLVRRGTLRQGDIIVAGHTWARVRNLLNEAGAEVAQAGPGTPVEVDGWRDQPDAGDLVIQAPSEEKAKSVVEFRLVKAERLRQATDMEAINSTRKLLRDQNEAEKLASSNPTAAAAEVAVGVAEVDSAKEEEGGSKLLEIPFLVKADVSGSVEAVNNALASLGNNEIQTKLIRSAVGPVSEFDIDLASATNATIITFNLALPPHLLAYSRHKNPPVTIHSHTIIYHLATSVKSILESHLPPSITIKVTGEAEILQIFQFKVKKKVVPFAGCRVKLGTVNKGSKVKVRRGGEVVWTGMLASLKNGKDDVLDVKDGGECGVGFDGWEGFKAGDVLQCFYEVVEKRELPMAF
ncbi:P-loop containing nucleoside triphosphate hydrolase protein [Tirmania nivea]|nr:P-loop containing nucleoside triphosphate hydrolase protein [Tirmania nivea]